MRRRTPLPAKSLVSRLGKMMPRAAAAEFAKRLSPAKAKQVARTLGRKRNPAADAQQAFEKFTGKASTGYTEYEVAQHFHANLAKIGKLNTLYVLLDRGPKAGQVAELRFQGADLNMSEDMRQLYILGGDQRLDLAALGLEREYPKDQEPIGLAVAIEYHCRKGFDKFEPTDYTHKFGEDGGEYPQLSYDRRSRLLYFSGGDYAITDQGIED